MRKFKIECSVNGFYFENGEDDLWEIVEANDYDHAEIVARSLFNCPIEIGEIFEIFDTPLNDQYLLVDMSDGFTYAIPAMFIVNKHAYSLVIGQFTDDEVSEAILNQSLPLFENNPDEMIAWAKQNLKWKDVEREARQLLRKKEEEPDYEQEWKNNPFTVR